METKELKSDLTKLEEKVKMIFMNNMYNSHGLKLDGLVKGIIEAVTLINKEQE